MSVAMETRACSRMAAMGHLLPRESVSILRLAERRYASLPVFSVRLAWVLMVEAMVRMLLVSVLSA